MKNQPDKLPLRLPTVALSCLLALIFLSSCAGSKITERGLSYARLGQEMPKRDTKSLKGHAVADTTFRDQEYSWRVSTVKYKQGNVYLEEDFFMEDVLNRIRIETPELKVKGGIRVGQTLQVLKEASDRWYVHPLPDYQVFEFYSQKFPRVHFLVSEPGKAMDETDWEKYPISDFDPASKIVGIVIF
ncbi:MAG: hypothetical protein H6581_20360 [Bacteroidia bacterium]|nr:hypothetical protein [Bacteroidia bacterium]